MKKVIALIPLLALTLTGCSQSDESLATDACHTAIKKEIPAEKLDFSDLKVGNMSDALFELSETGQRDHSEVVFYGTGNVISWNGSLEKKHIVICSVTVSGGSVLEVSLTASD